MSRIAELDQLLDQFLSLELNASTQSNILNGIDSQYREFIRMAPNYVPLLDQYNQFRIRNVGRLSFERPRFLVGAMNRGGFPNFHTYGLVRVADVVSLSETPEEGRIDRVFWNPFSDRFDDILERLPEGFMPHLFWDNQIDGQHHIPLGVESAPFPTVVGLCHMFRRNTIRHASKLFDVVLPLSRRFVPLVASFETANVVDIPFGLNWGAMGEVIQPGEQKTIDVSITFGGRASPSYGGFRGAVYAAAKAFAEKHGDRFNIVFSSGLTKDEYVDLLKRSRISVNVVGVHGPYNYRTCEIINAGALLYQFSSDRYPFGSSLDEYLADGEHYVSFDLDNFEERLLALLENPDEVARIADSGRRFLEESYRYDRLYEEMIMAVSKLDFNFADRPSETDSLYHAGQAYWHYGIPEISKLVVLSLPAILGDRPKVRDINLLAILPRLWEWYGRDEVMGLLRGYPALAVKLELGLEQAVDYLGERVGDTLIGHWNWVAAHLHLGSADQTTVGELLEALSRIDGPVDLDDPRRVFNSQVHPDYLSTEEYQDVRISFFEIPLLKHGESEASIADTYLDFMRWHCHRYLMVESGSLDDGERALALYPDNPPLHRELGDRYREAGDEIAAAEHYRRAREIDPVMPLDPSAETLVA